MRNLVQKNLDKVTYSVFAFVIAVMCFGMPLSRNMSENAAFRPMSDLADQNLDYKIYEYAFFTPELTFDYGAPLPVLYQNGSLTIPKDAKFGVLVSPEKENAFLKHFREAQVKIIDQFDMNPQPVNSSSHKTRLARILYQVEIN